MIKFSVQRERERLITKQKYKRSEQVRSLMEQRKGSSLGQRKDSNLGQRKDSSLGQRKDSTHRLKQQAILSPQTVFKDVALEEVMSEQGECL